MGAGIEPRAAELSFSARRPAVLAAALFMIGIALHAVAPHRPTVWIGMLAALLVAATLTMRRALTSCTLLALATLIGGIAAAQSSAYFYPADHVSAFAADEP